MQVVIQLDPDKSANESHHQLKTRIVKGEDIRPDQRPDKRQDTAKAMLYNERHAILRQ